MLLSIAKRTEINITFTLTVILNTKTLQQNQSVKTYHNRISRNLPNLPKQNTFSGLSRKNVYGRLTSTQFGVSEVLTSKPIHEGRPNEHTSKSIHQGCTTEHSSKSIHQGRTTELTSKSIQQGCQTKLTSKSIQQGRPTKLTSKSIQRVAPPNPLYDLIGFTVPNAEFEEDTFHYLRDLGGVQQWRDRASISHGTVDWSNRGRRMTLDFFSLGTGFQESQAQVQEMCIQTKQRGA